MQKLVRSAPNDRLGACPDVRDSAAEFVLPMSIIIEASRQRTGGRRWSPSRPGSPRLIMIDIDVMGMWALRVLSVSLQRGNADMYRKSSLVISPEQGLRYEAGLKDAILPD